MRAFDQTLRSSTFIGRIEENGFRKDRAMAIEVEGNQDNAV